MLTFLYDLESFAVSTLFLWMGLSPFISAAFLVTFLVARCFSNRWAAALVGTLAGTLALWTMLFLLVVVYVGHQNIPGQPPWWVILAMMLGMLGAEFSVPASVIGWSVAEKSATESDGQGGNPRVLLPRTRP